MRIFLGILGIIVILGLYYWIDIRLPLDNNHWIIKTTWLEIKQIKVK